VCERRDVGKWALKLAHGRRLKINVKSTVPGSHTTLTELQVEDQLGGDEAARWCAARLAVSRRMRREADKTWPRPLVCTFAVAWGAAQRSAAQQTPPKGLQPSLGLGWGCCPRQCLQRGRRNGSGPLHPHAPLVVGLTGRGGLCSAPEAAVLGQRQIVQACISASRIARNLTCFGTPTVPREIQRIFWSPT
jgi:hypothetical protein